jgi:hypothetical protein
MGELMLSTQWSRLIFQTALPESRLVEPVLGR